MKRLLYGLAVLALAVPAFGVTCANPTVAIADGRITDFDFVQANSDNFYQFDAIKGRSYSVEVRQDYDDINNDLSVGLAAPGFACPAPGTLVTPALTGTTDTTAAGFEPGVSGNTTRASFVAASTGTFLIQVHNANPGAGRYISVSVANTTLNSPRWAKFTGFFTAWGFQNNTAAPLTGTLTLFTGGGIQVATETFTIPANGVVFRDTQNSSSFNVIANGAGFARFTHNGPPGAVGADAFIDSTSGLFIQPVKFGREK